MKHRRHPAERKSPVAQWLRPLGLANGVAGLPLAGKFSTATRVMTLVLALVTGTICRAAETQADFYVSLRGSDSWSGTLATPNAQGTDGPFATLERARDAVRDLKMQKTTDIVVLIREGTYQLDKTVVFGREDSGQGDSTITYAAYPGETPVFSSGREIKDWEKVTGDLPGLPEMARGNVWVANVSGRFLTLYDDQGMLPRARSERFVPKGSATELRFTEGKLKSSWNRGIGFQPVS